MNLLRGDDDELTAKAAPDGFAAGVPSTPAAEGSVLEAAAAPAAEAAAATASAPAAGNRHVHSR
jgi:hypothetical protein